MKITQRIDVELITDRELTDQEIESALCLGLEKLFADAKTECPVHAGSINARTDWVHES